MIINNGFNVCNEKLKNDSIKSDVEYCDSRYAYLDEYENLLGFCCFEKQNISEVYIESLCSKNKVGKYLILKTLEGCMKNNISRSHLSAKSDERDLPGYYNQFGFTFYEEFINFNGIRCEYMELFNYNVLDSLNFDDEIFLLHEKEENVILKESEIIVNRPKINPFLGEISKLKK